MSGLNESGDDGLEGIDEEALIEVLKTKGLQDPEAQEMLQRWMDTAEAERDQLGSHDEEVGIDFKIRVATLYSKADLHIDGELLADEEWREAWDFANRFMDASQRERLLAKVTQAAGQCGYRF